MNVLYNLCQAGCTQLTQRNAIANLDCEPKQFIAENILISPWCPPGLSLMHQHRLPQPLKYTVSCFVLPDQRIL